MAALEAPAGAGWWPRYAARVAEQMHLCGPQSWGSLLAKRADLDAAAATLAAAAAAGTLDSPEAAAARRLRAAVLHPDTGQPIPLPFRMAAHVPVNSVLLWGMCSARGVGATVGWQVANQCFNAAQFRANRNATNSVGDAQLAASFVGAVASAMAVAGGLRRLFDGLAERAAAQGLAASHPRARLARWGGYAVPFLGAAAGKPLQIGAMRYDELSQGVAVSDAAGRPLGVSTAAGSAAVGMTVATRIIYLAPMLWIGPVQAALERVVPLLQRSRPLALASYVLHCGLNSAFATPACIALFEQRASLPVAALEEGPLKQRAQAEGLERVFFNKGL